MSGKIKSPYIYQLKIATLPALELKHAAEDLLLVVNKPKQRRGYSPNVDIKRYERANIVINGLKDGITKKQQLAELCGKNFTEIYKILKLLWKNGVIEDYHLNYYNVIPKKLIPFDTALLRNGLEWRRVEDIEVGDYIAQPISKSTKAPVFLDMVELLSEYYPVTTKYVYVSGNVKQCSCMPSIYEWMEENGVPVFDYGDRTKFLKEHNWTVKGYDVAYRTIHRDEVPIRINRFIEITPEIAFAMGLYLAEGAKSSPGFYYALNIKEIALFNRAKTALQGIVPYAKSYFNPVQGTNGARGFFNSIPVARMMVKLMGSGAHTKEIPNCFENAPDDVLLGFLEGYASGDGNSLVQKHHLSKKSDKKLQRVSISSCNLNILLSVRQLMFRFGIVTGIYKKKSSTSSYKGQVINGGINYELIVTGEQACKMSQLLWGHFEGEKTGRTARCSFILGDYVCLRVQRISFIKQT